MMEFGVGAFVILRLSCYLYWNRHIHRHKRVHLQH
uniref:Uncharacterized protein n=1 Tax=Arundo donax TaxID=35708 RepID=A0A0A8XV80_ARUDO